MLNRAAMRARVAAACVVNDDAESDSRAYLNQDLNEGLKRVWRARHWRERVIDTMTTGGAPVATVAPYTTGTAAFTLASASITGSGTTWTSAMSGRKIATAIGNPWYRFTYASATTGTLAQVYAEASATGATYSIFQDEYDLPKQMEVIISAQALTTDRGGRLEPTTEAALDEMYVHGTTGPPRVYAPTLPTTSGVMRIRLFPIPDAVYRIRVRGLRFFTDLTEDADVPLLGESKERAWFLATALEVQRRGAGRQITSDAEVEAAIQEEWVREAPQQPLSVRRGRSRGRGRFVFYMTE